MKHIKFTRLFSRLALTMIATAVAVLLVGVFTTAPRASAAVSSCTAGVNCDTCTVHGACLLGLFQEGHNIKIIWLSSDPTPDNYNIAWSRPGATGQFSAAGNKSVAYFNNALPYTRYHFRIQSCETHFLAHSTCSQWTGGEDIVTVGTSADVCVNGFVWREAGSNDFVCVTPATRSQAAYDNSRANVRIDPNGAYGPKSCIQGYVWREAFTNDLVCVPPQTRTQAANDNSQAVYRVVH